MAQIQPCCILTTLVLLHQWSCTAVENQSTTVRKMVRRNLTLGGLFSRYTTHEEGKCFGEISWTGVRRSEAMLFAVNRINADNTIIPNINLNVKLFDTCYSTRIALQQVLIELVLGSHLDIDSKCSHQIHSPVVGVIGPQTSQQAVHIARTLEVFHIPIISYGATSSELSEKSRYQYFSRTVPSDVYQAKAIVDLFEYFNWTYVSVVYTDEPYGQSALEEFQKESKKHGICIAMEEQLSAYSDEAQYQSTIEKLATANDTTEIIVLFCINKAIHGLLNAMEQHLSIFENMGIIVPDLNDLEKMTDKDSFPKIPDLIFTETISTQVPEFENYFGSLNVIKKRKSSWFKEFYEQVMNCSFNGENNRSVTVENSCSPNRTLGSDLYSNEPIAEEKVIDAVYAFAHALHQMEEDICPSNKVHCKSLDETLGEKLLSLIRNSSFKGITGEMVKFQTNGDVDGGYDIYHFDFEQTVKIGQWRGKLQMNSAYSWTTKFASIKSRCSKACVVHHIQRRVPGKPSCCWSCQECPSNAVVLNATNCHVCEKGYKPDKHQEMCVKIQALYYTVDGKALPLSLVIPPLILSGAGIIAVAFTACAFVKFNNTPLVKASGRELCYLILLGLLLSCFYPFICVLKPSRFKCFFQFTLDSLSATFSYVAIAVKTNRVYRIFDEKRVITQRPFLARPLSQILLSFGLISFQVLLLTALVIADFPTEELVYHTSSEVHLVCNTSNSHLVLSYSYNIILIIACTYYAYKTKHIPRNFKEARYIAFAMYGTCVMLVAFLVVFAIAAQALTKIRQLSVHCYRVSLMSTVLITCFFVPRVYIICFHPEKNLNHPTFVDTTNMPKLEDDPGAFWELCVEEDKTKKEVSPNTCGEN